MRIDTRFIKEAHSVSPTDDDTYITPYIIKNDIPVCKIKLPRNETENYKQLEIPCDCVKLVDINRFIYKSNLKRNFDHFGLYRHPSQLINTR